MTEYTTPDVEALHQIIGVGNFEANGSTGGNTYDLAIRIVKSEWLMEHDRKVAKEALEDYAVALEENPSAESWLAPETFVADIRDWADSL